MTAMRQAVSIGLLMCLAAGCGGAGPDQSRTSASQPATWPAASPPPALVVQAHPDGVEGLAFSSEGRTLASCSSDGAVRFWDVTTGKQTGQITQPRRSKAFAFSPDGRRFACNGTGRDELVLYHWPSLSQTHTLQVEGGSGPITRADFSQDGDVVATLHDDFSARLWDAGRGELLHTIPGSIGNYRAGGFSEDGKTFAAVGAHRSLIFVEVDTGRVLHHRRESVRGLHVAAFSPDLRLLAKPRSSLVDLLEPRTGERLRVLREPVGSPYALVFSRDGDRLYSGHRDGAIVVWDVATGRRAQGYLQRAQAVKALAVAPGEDRLASGGGDGVVRIWNLSAE